MISRVAVFCVDAFTLISGIFIMRSCEQAYFALETHFKKNTISFFHFARLLILRAFQFQCKFYNIERFE